MTVLTLNSNVFLTFQRFLPAETAPKTGKSVLGHTCAATNVGFCNVKVDQNRIEKRELSGGLIDGEMNKLPIDSFRVRFNFKSAVRGAEIRY